MDESALLAALEEGKFSGVALDVFEDEPLEAESWLWRYERVSVTPHNAFVSERNHERLLALANQNLARADHSVELQGVGTCPEVS